SSLCFWSLLRPPPTPPLSPYTTLSRSPPPARPAGRPAAAAPHRDVPPVDDEELFDPPELPASADPFELARRTVNRSRAAARLTRSEEHTSELQSRFDLVCRLLLEKKKG